MYKCRKVLTSFALLVSAVSLATGVEVAAETPVSGDSTSLTPTPTTESQETVVVKLPDGYVQALKDRSNNLATNAEVLATAPEDSIVSLDNLSTDLNFYTPKEEDKQIVISDLNTLSDGVSADVTLFAAEVVNSVREQFGTTLVTANTDAIKIADDLANYPAELTNYLRHPSTAERDSIGNKYGVALIENLGRVSGNISNLAELKTFVFNRTLDFLQNDSDFNWQHATLVTGLRDAYGFGKPYLGLGFRQSEYGTDLYFTIIQEALKSGQSINSANDLPGKTEQPKTPTVIRKTETIPFKTIYQDDPSLEIGVESVQQNGVDGVKTLTFTDGVLTSEEITTPVIDKIVKRGTKQVVPVAPVITTREEIIPFKTIYQDDSNLEIGVEIVQQNGVDGVKTLTFTDGVLTSEEITTPAVDKVIKRGTKQVAPETEKPEAPVTPEVPKTPETGQPVVTAPIIPETGSKAASDKGDNESAVTQVAPLLGADSTPKSATYSRVAARQATLPNTGETKGASVLSLLGMFLLGVTGLASKKRRS